MSDEKQFPEIPSQDTPSSDAALLPPDASENDLNTPIAEAAVAVPPTDEGSPESEVAAVSVETPAAEASPTNAPLPKKPVNIADEEVALTADTPPISAADAPFGKTDDGYAFKLPQPKFVKRANQEASERLDEAFEETDETFQMIAGHVDKLEAQIEWADQEIQAKDWRLNAPLTPEKQQTPTPPASISDKKEAEKRALAEQYKKMEEERRQRDNVHIEKMRAEREALEARMRAEHESRQTKVKSEMEATQARLRAEREAKRLEREAYEAQRRGMTPPEPKLTPPPAKPAQATTPEDKEQRALRNLSKPEPDTGENETE